MGSHHHALTSSSSSPPSSSSEQINETVLLIESSSDSPPPPTQNQTPFSRTLFTILLLITCIAVSSAAFAAFPSSSSSSSSSSSFLHTSIKTEAFRLPPPPFPSNSNTTKNNKLNKPAVILISSDGFRFGYQFKTSTPNINRLIKEGTEAETGLIPVFPTYTFPNHYSIVTGLYPSAHGIINNRFVEPETGDRFSPGMLESKWWLGEPIWETLANQGLKAAAYFWAGSEVQKGSWDCPKDFCMKFNQSVPFEERVDTVLGYFDLPSDDIPVFTALYFEEPDSRAHRVGPDDVEVTSAVARIDSMIGRLIDGLESRGIFEDVTVIMVGDHGMVSTCESKVIYLDELAPWVQIQADWVHSYFPLLAIWPPAGENLKQIVEQMNQGLQSGKVQNGKSMKVYLKEDLPSRLHYSESNRIPPIIGMVDEGFTVAQTRVQGQLFCGGAHGYDNAYFSMRSIFIGHGPPFARGRKVPSFENIQIYNIITSILNVKGAPNNGSDSFPLSILLPFAH